jgi:pimeloyl-ACP methyl ester carboxylesterase
VSGHLGLLVLPGATLFLNINRITRPAYQNLHLHCCFHASAFTTSYILYIQANMTTRPAIVISPGAFCPPVLYEDVASVLRSSGYEVHIVSHRSIGTPYSPPPTMYDDAAQIHDLLVSLADQGKEVVLVMHSYGGMPGTEAVKGVSILERKAQGKPGGVSHLLYVAALIAEVGMAAQWADEGSEWRGHVEVSIC